MNIDTKKLMQKVKSSSPKRGRITLYVDLELYERFKKQCSDLAPSRVVEEFMREVVASSEQKKK